MKVALTVNDFLDRAERVYGDRIGIIDEPDQPAPSWGSLTYRQVAERARAQAASLDALGIGVGERVAMVSHNAARLFTSFYGVSGSGRILVPINFRLNAAEIGYIVEHCGASVLIVDPELDEDLAGLTAAHRFVIGDDADEALFSSTAEPRPWTPDED
ncbi:MAG TPA: AMP-binding protein, partial [Acidimicrobiales bacterium]